MPTAKHQFSGQSKAKGRNGLFKLHTGSILHVTYSNAESDEHILELSSKSTGSSAIAVYATLEDLQGLHDLLTQHLKQVVPRTEEDEKFFQAAKEHYAQEGELEFDDDARVSISSDGGAYVECWRWVENEEAGIGRNSEQSEEIED